MKLYHSNLYIIGTKDNVARFHQIAMKSNPSHPVLRGNRQERSGLSRIQKTLLGLLSVDLGLRDTSFWIILILASSLRSQCICLIQKDIIFYREFVLLLLATPTWLWGRCGRHNSPPGSSVMDFIFRRSDGYRVSVDTVHPSLLRSSSFSYPRWYHLQRLSSDVFLVSSIYVAKPPQSCFPAPLCYVLYVQSLPDVIVSLSHGLLVCGRMPIFISVTSSFFTWELVNGTVSIPYLIAD